MTTDAIGRDQITPTYAAAERAAEAIHSRFKRTFEPALGEETPVLEYLSMGEIIQMIDAAFWASLRKEEGYVPKISAALLPVESVENPLRFEQPLPFAPTTLARMGPAVERPGIHLGVWRTSSGLQIWGTTRVIPRGCFVLEVTAPGLMVVKQSRGEASGKYANVAVLEGDSVKILSENSTDVIDCPGLIRSLMGLEEVSPTADDVNPLVLLAVSMRSHARGGSLLVVPSDRESWRESIIHPIRYCVSPPFTGLSDLLRTGLHDDHSWQDSLRHSVDEIAGLTAVDGATIINNSYELLAFGTKIGRARESDRIEKILVTEPVIGALAETMHPSQLGGTRHLSAAQFVHDQRDALALVASQDGRFTIFAWSPCENMVHAHRIEALLL